jgi:hypothetical protein
MNRQLPLLLLLRSMVFFTSQLLDVRRLPQLQAGKRC